MGSSTRQKGPQNPRDEDVEGHGPIRPRDVKAIPTDEADVEGHNFGHNSVLSRQAAQSREREIQRNLRQHDVKSEARRPFFKRGQ